MKYTKERKHKLRNIVNRLNRHNLIDAKEHHAMSILLTDGMTYGDAMSKSGLSMTRVNELARFIDGIQCMSLLGEAEAKPKVQTRVRVCSDGDLRQNKGSGDG